MAVIWFFVDCHCLSHDYASCGVGTRLDVTGVGCGKRLASRLALEILEVPPTIAFMEISLAPELEAKLARIASEAGKAANQVVQELVTDYLDHDEWFKREVQKGLASLDDGKFVSHEDVGRQIERILRP